MTLHTSLPLSFYNGTLLSSPTEPRDGVKRAQNYITATVKPYSTEQCLCITGAFKSQQKPLVHGVKFIPCCVTQSLHKPQWHFGQRSWQTQDNLCSGTQGTNNQWSALLNFMWSNFPLSLQWHTVSYVRNFRTLKGCTACQDLTRGINQKLILNTIFAPHETIKIISVSAVGSTFTKRVLWNLSANKKRLSWTNKRPYRCPRAPITPRTQWRYIRNEIFPESSDGMLIRSLIEATTAVNRPTVPKIRASRVLKQQPH